MNRWFALLTLCWGLTSMSIAFTKSYAVLLILRLLFGVFESGFFPGCAYYFTLWFTQRERTTVLALFSAGRPISGIIGGPLGHYFLQINALGLQGYQWYVER